MCVCMFVYDCMCISVIASSCLSFVRLHWSDFVLPSCLIFLRVSLLFVLSYHSFFVDGSQRSTLRLWLGFMLP